MGFLATTTGPPRKRKKPRPSGNREAASTQHQDTDESSGTRAQGQAPKNLTTARLGWLRHCRGCVDLVSFALCKLLAEYAGYPKSVERYKLGGVLTAYPSYWTMASRLGWPPHEIVRELERLERQGLVQTTASRSGAPQYQLVCGRPAEKPASLAEQLEQMLKALTDK